MSTHSFVSWARRGVVALLVLIVAAATATSAAAEPPRTDLIVLPGAQSAEGIAAGTGSTFYAGELFTGDIFRGDVRRGRAARFIDAPDGRQAAGMKADTRHDLLFVAGALTGQAYVYTARTGGAVTSYQLGTPPGSFINDVALTRDGAWFTDSFQPVLYFVPVSPTGVPGPARTLALSGPAAELTGAFNLNGIQATEDGATLVVAHSANGALYTVDPKTGASAVIAGVSVPAVDGLVLSGHLLWAVQNSNQVTRIRLDGHLTSGTVQDVITSANFETTSTAARFGDTLAVVNAKFDTGFPPTAAQYDVALVDAGR